MPTLAPTFSVVSPRLGQRGDQLAGDMSRILGLSQVAQYDDELVAAETAKQIIVAQVLVQAGRGSLQQRITRGVAEAVVDGLEAVQVDEQHRQ